MNARTAAFRRIVVFAALNLGIGSLALALPAPARAPVRHNGFLPWSWDAKESKVLLEVVAGEEFLWGAGLAGGAGTIEASLDRAQLSDLALCAFERSGSKMLLVRRQTAQRSGVADRERSRVVVESFPSAILAALPVVSESGGRVVVDATAFLRTDPFVARLLKESEAGEWTQQNDLTAFRLERSGAFPRNTEIEVTLTFTSPKPPAGFAAVLPDGRTMSLTIHHSFVALPAAGFETREHDPRAGYFTTDWTEHTRPFGEPIGRQLACRWRLEKKNPEAALSAPVEPIVFYLDRGIPEPERTAVREAALWWNHAFAEAGFSNALELRDLPEGATFLDARYSGIAWVSRSERAWSIGQSQTDPRTGEIVHAVVILDSHRRRTTARMWQNLAPPGRRGCAAADAPDFADFAADAPDVSEQELVLARLRYLTAHEVGHALGIGHNWAATTFGWGSVMDYLGPHIEPAGEGLDLSDAFPSDIGSFDRLAIRWGYTPKLDGAAGDRLIRDGISRGVIYPLSSDARWAEYDWGNDPAQWLTRSLAVRRTMLERRFGAAQLSEREPLYRLHERFNLAYLYHRFAIQAAQQEVGGQYQTNAVKGDAQIPWQWVPRIRQQNSLRALLASLGPAALAVPDAVARALVPSADGVPASREQFASEAGDAVSPLTAARVLAGLIVNPLLSPERASRLALAPAGESLTLREVLSQLSGVWSEPEPSTPAERPLQRIAQRAVVEAAMRLAASDAAPEARAEAFAALEAIQRRAKSLHSSDPSSEAQVRLIERELAAFLAAPSEFKPRNGPRTPPGRPIGGAR